MSRNTVNVIIAAVLGASFGWVAARALPWNAPARLAAVEAGQQAILKQLQGGGGGTVLQAAPPEPGAANNALPLPSEPITLAGAPSLGRADAPLTLVEFSDFQCPYCGRHARETLEQIKKEYVDTGKVRYVFRHYPIESLHPQAWAAARVAECAGRQDKFWPIHTAIFANQKQMSDADLEGYARGAGADIPALKKCIADPAVTAKITQDRDEGSRAGVVGTPMFFIGKVESGKLRALKRVNGADPFPSFQQAIDALLSGS